MKSFLTLLTILLLCSAPEKMEAQAAPDDASFVWVDSGQLARHRQVYFQRSFQIGSPVAEATIHLFADSRYHLFVNGQFVGFGPSRFFPEAPQYDTYDISRYLRHGDNLLKVKVLSNGINTYQQVMHTPGLIVWGDVRSGQGKVELSTPNLWQAKEAKAPIRHAPRYSFAQGAVEVVDDRKEPCDWLDPSCTVGWQPVVVLPDTGWGALTQRKIPTLAYKKTAPLKVEQHYLLDDSEEIYSFEINTTDRNKEEWYKKKRLFAYTYIYSPQAQQVDAGIWWGEHYLNGEGPIPDTIETKAGYNRKRMTLNLQKGWNHFFVKYDLIWAYWEFKMALPKGKGLVVSAEKKKRSEVLFCSAGPFADSERSQILELQAPFAPGELPKLSVGWKNHLRTELTTNPATDISWRAFKGEVPFEPAQVSNFSLSEADQTLVFDMGDMVYGRFFLSYTAPKGTIVDVAFAEEMEHGRPVLLKRHAQYTATRHIAKEGSNYFETFRPYGTRFLQVNIRNHGAPIKLHELGVIRHVYPLAPVGAFQCSESMFNELWKMGSHTIGVCADDSFIDPFRERGIYAGDTFVESAIAYAAFGETALMRKTLRELTHMYADVLAQFPTINTDRYGTPLLADYPFIALLNIHWYYQLTGDLSFVRTVLPGYVQALDRLAGTRDDQGLFPPLNHFIEWTQIQKNNTQLAAMHALLGAAYGAAGELLQALGQEEKSAAYQALSKEVLHTTQVTFWDAEAGAFFDGFDAKGQHIRSHYPNSSAWPSLFGATSDDQEQQLIHYYQRELPDIGDIDRHRKISPYGAFYLLGALYKNGHADIAEDFMRRHWSEMVYDGNGLTWENFGKGNGQSSLSHGWSGGPTFYLSTEVLGVQLGIVDGMNQDEIIISPQAARISWARGRVPHPLGTVEVSWEVCEDRLYLDYKVDTNVPVRVVPRGRLATKELWVNGLPQAAVVNSTP